MSKTDQLEWEARFARPAGIAAILAGLLLLAGQVVFQTIFEDRPGLEVLPEFLFSVDANPGTLIASRALQALAALSMILVFYYLFRAVRERNPQMPKWFVYLVFAGPVFYAIAQILGALAQIDVASQFVDGEPIRGSAGDERADRISEDGRDIATAAFGMAGTVSVAFLFVMLPLRARRVGLMSPFMGILGVICGVLLVLPLIPGVPVIVQAFWLGAVGMLILGRWPGGRGPAWETGEAEPWPTPARRRGLVDADDEAAGGGKAAGGERAPGGEGAAGDGLSAGDDRAAGDGSDPRESSPPDPPQRPSSRKRKRR